MLEISCTIRKGNGNVNYNNRKCKIKEPHAHWQGIPLTNIQLVRRRIGDVYGEIFNPAIERYNSKRKPCRQIKTGYYEHIFKCKPSITL